MAAMTVNPAANSIDSGEQRSLYAAVRSRDARFDGRFFVGVTSTGIYCRPVCRVRTPLLRNCRFFGNAASAEHAGFRPCLRCRPELAPASRHWSIEDASAILAQQAARLLDEPEAWQGAAPSMQALAQRLGVTDRHVRRIFEAQFGVSPMQYLQTRRLLLAKQLLTDSAMPVAQVALAAGFSSLRRFNAAFAEHYRMSPSRLRGAAVQDRLLRRGLFAPDQRHERIIVLFVIKLAPDKIVNGPETKVTLKFVLERIALRIKLGRRGKQNERRSAPKFGEQVQTNLFLEMFDHVADDDQLVIRQTGQHLAHVAIMDLVVNVIVGRRGVGGKRFDPFDPGLPIVARVAALKYIQILAAQESPLAESYADIEYRARLQPHDPIDHLANVMMKTGGHLAPA